MKSANQADRRTKRSIHKIDVNDDLDVMTSDGVEVELDDDSAGDEPISHPFDPSKLFIISKIMTLDLFIKRIAEGEIDLSPPFQRKDVWNDKARSRLIESILIRIPLPAFYIDATDDDNWIVVDGHQRLTTIKQFAVDKTMKLIGLEFLDQYNEKKYVELPRDLRRRLEETQVTVYLIQAGTPEQAKFNIFERINTGGMPLSRQEIRHALNQGAASRLLDRLSSSEHFLEATRGSIRDKRMTAQEFVLRFIAFHLAPNGPTTNEEFDYFLHETMKRLNEMSVDEIDQIEKKFYKAMDRAKRLFGDYAFRKYDHEEGRKNPLNKALFETWSVALAEINEDRALKLIRNRESLKAEFLKLLQEKQEFSASISQATGNIAKIKLRFDTVRNLVKEFSSR
jgi:hypothetical protein